VGSKIWDPPEQTPALLDSISQIAVYDFAMVNRDRNSGNWMLDTKNNVMKGIDNGLVGLECGRGTMSVRRIFTEYTPDNTENYCRKLTKKSIGKIITREHFEKAKAFVESPAYDELIDAHYGPGTQGGDDLDKSGIDLDKFKKNLHAGSKMGIKTLEDILISEGK
jgi:hypothetical protein